MIILMRLLGRFFEMAYEFQACAARIRTLPWKIFLGYVRSGTPVPPSHLPCTWIGIFIPDFGHSANNYAKLIFIKFVHPSTCNVFDAANEIAHDFYSTGSCFHGGRTGN